jgi:hypothetical protein
MGTRGLFPPGTKQRVRDADRSPQTTAEVKNMSIHISPPPPPTLRLHGIVFNWLSTGRTLPLDSTSQEHYFHNIINILELVSVMLPSLSSRQLLISLRRFLI